MIDSSSSSSVWRQELIRYLTVPGKKIQIQKERGGKDLRKI